MITPTPVLIFGWQGGTDEVGLYRYGDSHLDGEIPIYGRYRTAEVAVAGISGRASFQRLFVAVTFTRPFRLRLTPIVDGKLITGEYADIQVTQGDFDDPAQNLTIGTRATHLFEVVLTLPYLRGGIERFRYAMQGAYFQVEIEQMDALSGLGELIIEKLELEYKVLSKSAVQ